MKEKEEAEENKIPNGGEKNGKMSEKERNGILFIQKRMCKQTYSGPVFIYRATHTGTMLSLTYFTGVKNWRLSS